MKGNPYDVERVEDRIDLTAIARWNRENQAAIRENARRDKRENHLDSLYYWREVTE